MEQKGDGNLCPRMGVSHCATCTCPQTSLPSQHKTHFIPLQTSLLSLRMQLSESRVKEVKAEQEATIHLHSGTEGSAARDSE